MLALEAVGKTPADHPADAELLANAFQNLSSEESRIAATRAYANTVYSDLLRSNHRRLFVDKTPRYYLVLDFIKRVFPRARFVWLHRNPLDVAASYKRTWSIDIAAQLRECPEQRACVDLVIGLKRLLEFSRTHQSDVFALSYESLVTGPDDVMASVCSFLGVRRVRGLAEFDVGESTFSRSAFGDRCVLLTHAPHHDSIGSWRRVLSDADLQTLLDALGTETFQKLGYEDTLRELSSRGISLPTTDHTEKCLQSVQTGLPPRNADYQLSSAVASISSNPQLDVQSWRPGSSDEQWGAQASPSGALV